MFYDKESMLEMFEISVTKKQWKHFLITSELFGSDSGSLSTKEVISMHKQWRELVKNKLNEKDAAYQINQGNIFVLIHDSNIPQLKKSLENLKIISSNDKTCGVQASFILLSEDETQFILSMS